MTSLNTLNKKTANTAMVALLLMAGVFFGPSASADVRQEMKVRFQYHPAQSAEQIYADFERTANKACGQYGVRPMALRKLEKKCAHEVLDLAVAKLGRADVAQVHTGKVALVASR